MAAYAGFMTQVTCRLTAKNRDQLQNPTLGNRVRATFTFYTRFVIIAVSVAEYPGLENRSCLLQSSGRWSWFCLLWPC